MPSLTLGLGDEAGILLLGAATIVAIGEALQEVLDIVQELSLYDGRFVALEGLLNQSQGLLTGDLLLKKDLKPTVAAYQEEIDQLKDKVLDIEKRVARLNKN